MLTRGATAIESSGSNSFRTQGFQNDGIATTNTDYFQNTFSAAPGYVLSLSSINARFAGTSSYSAAPGASIQYAYSLNGTTFTLIGTPTVLLANGSIPQINLSGITALQNVADNITVTLRVYATGQTATGGWGYNSSTAGEAGLAIGGSVTVVSAGCNISGSGIGTSTTCNDNSTAAVTADDYITFNLNPTGVTLGTNYTLTVSSGTITPTTAAYTTATSFQLQNGSAGAGNVTVTITDGTTGGCTFAQVITDPGACSTPVAGINENSINTSIKLYPNPTNDLLTILFEGNIATVSVVDLSGKSVFTKEIASNETIDVSALYSGTYFVSLEIDGTTYTERVVVK